MANAKPLKITDEGKMLSGCIVRHLVMPLCTNDSKSVLKWFKRELPETTYLSLMSQYTPTQNVSRHPKLKSTINESHYKAMIDYCVGCEIKNVFIQDVSSAVQDFIPDF